MVRFESGALSEFDSGDVSQGCQAHVVMRFALAKPVTQLESFDHCPCAPSG